MPYFSGQGIFYFLNKIMFCSIDLSQNIVDLSLSGLWEHADEGDGLYRPQSVPRPCLLQRGQPQWGEGLKWRPGHNSGKAKTWVCEGQDMAVYRPRHGCVCTGLGMAVKRPRHGCVKAYTWLCRGLGMAVWRPIHDCVEVKHGCVEAYACLCRGLDMAVGRTRHGCASVQRPRHGCVKAKTWLCEGHGMAV